MGFDRGYACSGFATAKEARAKECPEPFVARVDGQASCLGASTYKNRGDMMVS